MMILQTKYAVLDILAKRKGEAVSGSELASVLGVSRMAISKGVKALCAEGYKITAKTNCGYTLAHNADVFSKTAIMQYYTRPVFFENSTQSTNLTAKALAQSGAVHGTLCAAASQSGGKGRRARRFFSPPATGIYFSVILRGLSLENAGLITAAAAVSCVRAFKRLYEKQLSIKWVNDLIYNGKKVGGILTQAATSFETGEIEYAVVGIGLNLLSPEQGFPAEIASTAGAVFTNAEQPSRARLCAEIAEELLSLCAESAQFMDEYIKASCIIGHKIEVIRGEERRSATALGINKRGHLIVKYQGGETDTLYFGEVSILRKEEEL